jgi:arylsulfatase A-like enzyme
VVDRLIADDGLPLFDEKAFYERERVFSWEPSRKGGDGSWIPVGADLSNEVAGDELILRSSSKSIRLDGSVRTSAAEVDIIEIQVQGRDIGAVVLQWCPPGESYSPERKISAAGRDRDKNGIYTFKVGQYPAWTGEITRLRFTFWSPPKNVVTLQKIVAYRHGRAQDRFDASLAEPWKFDINRDVRNGRVGWPDRPLSWKVHVPVHAHLEFSVGASGPIPESSKMSVLLFGEGGDDQERALWQKTIESSASTDIAEWTEVRIDLSEFAGRDVELRFVISQTYDPSPNDGFLIWANPAIRSAPGNSSKPNIILVVIDTLRADRLSAYGYARATSPNIDRWTSDNAVLFRNVVAPAPWTLPSHVSLFSGFDAHRHGVNFGSPAPRQMEMLAELLAGEGYSTHAITGGLYLHPNFGLAQGFDSFRYWPKPASAGEIESNLESALNLLSQRDRGPFFLFFHTYEVHNPYRPRQPFFEDNSSFPAKYWVRGFDKRREPEKGFLVESSFVYGENNRPDTDSPLPDHLAGLPSDLYDSGVAFTDQKIGALLARLEAEDLRDRCLVILTSDHGEMLGEHGAAGHSFLYEENIMVPLLIRHPNRLGAGASVTNQVRLVDVLPTILETSAIPVPSEIDGQSLYPFLVGSAADHPDMAISYSASSNNGLALRFSNRSKYILRDAAWREINGQEMLFDLGNDANAREIPSDDIERMRNARRIASDILNSDAQAVHVRLRNPGSGGHLSGQISGAMVTMAAVKGVFLPPESVRWGGKGTLIFDVPPETEYELLLILDSGYEFEITTTYTTSDRVFELLAPVHYGDIQRGKAWVVDSSGWSEGPVDADTEGPSVALFWRSSFEVRSEGSPLLDKETLDQLRELGYGN